ncbi:hypothetical protein GBA52_000982 [Prunus armeniaca]|nr:hypothetical protein GBA52_000982 [Prunus armeniaca]
MGIRWIVGNGKSIPFWTAHWVFPFPLIDLIPMTQRSSLNLNLVVSEFLTDQQWDISKLQDVVDQDIIDKISVIPLPLSPLEDQLIWGPNPSGIFSIKSAYHVQMHDTSYHCQAALLKKMWGIKVPPKVKIFSWLLKRKRLQVRGHLNRFLPQINPKCPFCNSHRETIPHLFSTCHFAQSIWSCTNMAAGITFPNFDFLTWLGSLLTTPNSSSLDSLSKALLLCWQIWEAMNHLIFKDIKPHLVRVLTMAGKNTISVAECITLRDGLAYVAHRGWRKILAEGDSKLIINCVNKKAVALWSINLLIKDIALLSSFFESCSFSHVFREANFTADAVTSLGHGISPSKLWEAGLPLNCSTPFFFDLLGPACPRDFCL